MRDWRSLLQSEGYAARKANLAISFNSLMGGVHSDDFNVLANSVAIDHISKVLASKYKVRKSHRLGFGKHSTRVAVALNRITVFAASE